MEPTYSDLQEQEAALCEQLEVQLRLYYDLRTAIRTAAWEQPLSIEQVLKTWTQIHRQQQQLQKSLKTILYEKQCRNQ